MEDSRSVVMSALARKAYSDYMHITKQNTSLQLDRGNSQPTPQTLVLMKTPAKERSTKVAPRSSPLVGRNGRVLYKYEESTRPRKRSKASLETPHTPGSIGSGGGLRRRRRLTTTISVLEHLHLIDVREQESHVDDPCENQEQDPMTPAICKPKTKPCHETSVASRTVFGDCEYDSLPTVSASDFGLQKIDGSDTLDEGKSLTADTYKYEIGGTLKSGDISLRASPFESPAKQTSTIVTRRSSRREESNRNLSLIDATTSEVIRDSSVHSYESATSNQTIEEHFPEPASVTKKQLPRTLATKIERHQPTELGPTCGTPLSDLKHIEAGAQQLLQLRCQGQAMVRPAHEDALPVQPGSVVQLHKMEHCETIERIPTTGNPWIEHMPEAAAGSKILFPDTLAIKMKLDRPTEPRQTHVAAVSDPELVGNVAQKQLQVLSQNQLLFGPDLGDTLVVQSDTIVQNHLMGQCERIENMQTTSNQTIDEHLPEPATVSRMLLRDTFAIKIELDQPSDPGQTHNTGLPDRKDVTSTEQKRLHSQRQVLVRPDHGSALPGQPETAVQKLQMEQCENSNQLKTTVPSLDHVDVRDSLVVPGKRITRRNAIKAHEVHAASVFPHAAAIGNPLSTTEPPSNRLDISDAHLDTSSLHEHDESLDSKRVEGPMQKRRRRTNVKTVSNAVASESQISLILPPEKWPRLIAEGLSRIWWKHTKPQNVWPKKTGQLAPTFVSKQSGRHQLNGLDNGASSNHLNASHHKSDTATSASNAKDQGRQLCGRQKNPFSKLDQASAKLPKPASARVVRSRSKGPSNPSDRDSNNNTTSPGESLALDDISFGESEPEQIPKPRRKRRKMASITLKEGLASRQSKRHQFKGMDNDDSSNHSHTTHDESDPVTSASNGRDQACTLSSKHGQGSCKLLQPAETRVTRARSKGPSHALDRASQSNTTSSSDDDQSDRDSPTIEEMNSVKRDACVANVKNEQDARRERICLAKEKLGASDVADRSAIYIEDIAWRKYACHDKALDDVPKLPPSGTLLDNIVADDDDHSCTFSFNQETRILRATLKSGVNTLSPKTKEHLYSMMERDDIAVVTDGLCQGLDASLWNHHNIVATAGEMFHHLFRRFKPTDAKISPLQQYNEVGTYESMTVHTYFDYLAERQKLMEHPEDRQTAKRTFSYTNKHGKAVELDLNEVIYMLDYDIKKILPLHYQNFVDTFLFSEILPGGKMCAMNAVNHAARPDMGPNLYVTPAGAFTKLHKDGYGTVDSGHLCLSGYNEVVIFRRLPNGHDHQIHGEAKGNSEMPHSNMSHDLPLNWPTKTDIVRFDELNYCPIVLILGPGEHLHIGKGRLHAFRKLSAHSLAKDDCHSELRNEVLSKLKREGKDIRRSVNFSIAWDWSFLGWTPEGINREMTATLECALFNRSLNYPKQSLAIPKLSVLASCKAAIAALLSDQGRTFGIQTVSNANRQRNLDILKGLLPSLEFVVNQEIEAEKSSGNAPLSHPHSWEDHSTFPLDPFGNADYVCRICFQELSNTYMHCNGCEEILKLDFNVCSDCYSDLRHVEYYFLNNNHDIVDSMVHHAGSYPLVDKCGKCSIATACAHCGRCRGDSCVCHNKFTLQQRFWNGDTLSQILTDAQVMVGDAKIPFYDEVLPRLQEALLYREKVDET